MTAKVPEELDAIADRALGYRPQKPEPEPSGTDQVEAWFTSIASILDEDELRLDASYFSPEVERMLAAMDETRMRAEPLG